jgi:tripartite-type tricarboxylate transporter receptor subunit TctC
MIFPLFLRPLPKLARGTINTVSSALLALVLAVTFGHAAADDYPSRPIRIIVPLAAGGSSDAAARLAAAALSRHINQNVIVENRAGGGGAVGTEAAAHADPDGYTLLLSNAAAFTVIPTSRKVNYDVEKDFVALGQILSAPQALVVDADAKFKSVRELVEYARANPDKVSFGSAGIGTTTHLSIQLLQQDASISLVHVPYRATNLSVADVISHSIDAVFGDIATLVSLVTAGKLKALATTGDARSPLLPDVPTMVELGYPRVRTVNWFGLHVSSGTPKDIQQRLKQAVEAMQTDPEFRAMLTKNATSTGTVGADAFDKMIHEERERLAPVIRALGPIN